VHVFDEVELLIVGTIAFFFFSAADIFLCFFFGAEERLVVAFPPSTGVLWRLSSGFVEEFLSLETFLCNLVTLRFFFLPFFSSRPFDFRERLPLPG